MSPWQTARLIKGPEDYAVVQYMVEHTEYVADYFPIEQAMDWLGEEGVVLCALPHSPMQMLMIDWVGSEGGRFFYHHADYPDLVEELYQALCARAASRCTRSPPGRRRRSCCAGTTSTGCWSRPSSLRPTFMPVYEAQAEVLHAHGQADGRAHGRAR